MIQYGAGHRKEHGESSRSRSPLYSFGPRMRNFRINWLLTSPAASIAPSLEAHGSLYSAKRSSTNQGPWPTGISAGAAASPFQCSTSRNGRRSFRSSADKMSGSNNIGKRTVSRSRRPWSQCERLKPRRRFVSSRGTTSPRPRPSGITAWRPTDLYVVSVGTYFGRNVLATVQIVVPQSRASEFTGG